MKNIGVLGSGVVGVTLANGLKNAGYDVSLANRSGHNVENWNGEIGTFNDVAEKSDMIILAVKGSAAEKVISSIKDNVSGKTILDTTNPISEQPPEDGVLKFFTTLDDSLMERLQKIASEANFVKCFSSVGNAFMVNPDFDGIKPVMFICGNSEAAKKETAEILQKLGWDNEDFGGVKSARAIEPLCILWCIPGIQKNQWSHAFTLLKK